MAAAIDSDGIIGEKHQEGIKIEVLLDTDHAINNQDTSDEEGEMEMKFQAMLSHIANSGVTIHSQQLGDDDMSVQDKIHILTQFFSQKPVIFLERYHGVLRVEDLPCFSHLSHIYEVEFYSNEVTKMSNAKTSNVQKKNRRYEALKRLESAGEYFSDEQMRSRDPLMFEHYIGQYQTNEERYKMKKEIDKSDLKLSTILTEFMEEANIKLLHQRQKEDEEMVEEEEDDESEEEEDDEDSDEMDDQDTDEAFGDNDTPGTSANAFTSQQSPPKRKVKIISEEERELLRQEFRHHMQEKFLKGSDKDFDYSQVDNNVEYDSLDIRGRDEEESYFDEEEPREVAEQTDSGSDDHDDGCKVRTEGNNEQEHDGTIER